MDVLKDQWIATQPEENDITSYVLSLREHMEEGHEIAQQNWKKAQIKQNQWYDQHAREKATYLDIKFYYYYQIAHRSLKHSGKDHTGSKRELEVLTMS